MEKTKKLELKDATELVLITLVFLFCFVMIRFYGEWGECAACLIFASSYTSLLLYSWFSSRELARIIKKSSCPKCMALLWISLALVVWFLALAMCT